MSHPQIETKFSVHNGQPGEGSRIMASSMLTHHRPEPIGGKYLPQYIGRRHDMDALAQRLQIDYDEARAA